MTDRPTTVKFNICRCGPPAPNELIISPPTLPGEGEFISQQELFEHARLLSINGELISLADYVGTYPFAREIQTTATHCGRLISNNMCSKYQIDTMSNQANLKPRKDEQATLKQLKPWFSYAVVNIKPDPKFL